MSNKEAENLSRKDFSIECAKAYITDAGDEESLEALRDKIDQIKRNGKSYTLTLLVDDKSYQDREFDFDQYGSWLEQNGFGEASIYKESQIKGVCDGVLRSIDSSKLSPPVRDMLGADKEYPSPLYIATWFLLRLGLVKSSHFPHSLQANSLYNIIPESFKPGEDQALEIIRATPHSRAVEHINYQFIPSN